MGGGAAGWSGRHFVGISSALTVLRFVSSQYAGALRNTHSALICCSDPSCVYPLRPL
jgi:hypothetical protein